MARHSNESETDLTIRGVEFPRLVMNQKDDYIHLFHLHQGRWEISPTLSVHLHQSIGGQYFMKKVGMRVEDG